MSALKQERARDLCAALGAGYCFSEDRPL